MNMLQNYFLKEYVTNIKDATHVFMSLSIIFFQTMDMKTDTKIIPYPDSTNIPICEILVRIK